MAVAPERAAEGFKLHGLLYPSPQGDGGRVVIGFHGFKSSALSEYGPFAKRFHEMGWDLLIVDQRAHGQSGGDYCAMGIKERTDAVRWAEFAAARYPRILLHGVSMGAATVCRASGQALPPQVEGVVGDCAYASGKRLLEIPDANHGESVAVNPDRCFEAIRQMFGD